MPLSSDELLRFVREPLTSVMRGRAMASARTLRKEGTPAARLQSEFLQALAAMPTSQPLPTKNHLGAEQNSRPSGNPFRGTIKAINRPRSGLTESELRWLDRLPKDPSQVTLEDARTVAAMAAYLPKGHHDDARLLESIARPLREFHDQHTVKPLLAEARTPLPNMPAELGAAVSATFAHELAGSSYSDDVALAAGHAAMTEALNERRAAWESTGAQFETDVDAANAEAREQQRVLPA
jgi:hypothetical protein